MIAAVDLHQFAQAGGAVPRLVDLGRALPAWHPEAGVNHDSAHTSLGDLDAMPLA